jgi:HD superfamily phosphohydrolase
VTSPNNINHDSIRGFVPAPEDGNYSYWRTVLRTATLCHDTGHLPLSHAAEKDLPPPGIRHEHLSRDLIPSEELRPILEDIKVQPAAVARIAVGPEHSDSPFDTWESILNEIIGGDIFGADRIDYLLRDAHHAGVAYGFGASEK